MKSLKDSRFSIIISVAVIILFLSDAIRIWFFDYTYPTWFTGALALYVALDGFSSLFRKIAEARGAANDEG